MELLTKRHSGSGASLPYVDDVDDVEPLAPSARLVRAVALTVAAMVGIAAWRTPGLGVLATVVVVAAVAVAVAADWRQPADDDRAIDLRDHARP